VESGLEDRFVPDERDIRIAELEALVAELRQQISDLMERLESSSRNSSRAPSSDDPRTRAERREAARVARKASQRSAGGQPGQEPRQRKMFDPDAVDEIVTSGVAEPECLCGGAWLDDGETVHQVAELPERMVYVTEYRRQRVRCACCRKRRTAPLPVDVSESAFGPKLQGWIVSLRFEHKVSVRCIQQLIRGTLGCPISTGVIIAICDRAASVLEQSYQGLVDAVQASSACCADETSWALNGERRWLWMAATRTTVVMMIRPDRSQESATALLGAYQGVVLCDRYAGYNHLDERAACWAHLKRDFLKVAGRTNRHAKRIGTQLADIASEICARYRDFNEHASRERLATDITPLHDRVVELLIELAEHGDDKSATLADTLLTSSFDSLWRFIDTDGIEPTNNRAERLVRHPVMLRKLTCGSRSTSGEATTATLLSILATCRLQAQSFTDYVAEALAAATRGDPIHTLT